MQPRVTCLLLAFLFSCCCFAQTDRVYQWSWKKDGYILSAATAGYVGSNILRSKADKATPNSLRNLKANGVWALDRLAIGNNSIQAKEMSDMMLFGSLTLPFLTYLDPKVRNEKGVVLGMFMETMLINNGLTNFFKASTKRYRPYTYSISSEEGLSNSSRESFISGHTSNVAAATFFTAQVLTDLHPDSNLKPYIWTAAAVLPAVTGYLRFKAGRHFPTDVMAGYTVGALVGFLIPKWHQIKLHEDVALDLLPVSGGAGLSLTFNLH